MRLLAMKESKGELPKGTVHKWAEHTPDIKHLPEHVKKASAPIADAFSKMLIGRRD